MSNGIRYSLVAFLLISFSFTYAQKTFTPAEAKNHVDEVVVIKGEVSQVSVTKAGQIYFNMEGKYPDNTFSAVILKNNASLIENAKDYEGKIVEISGKVKLYNNKPEIVIEKKEQIVVVPKEEPKK